MTNEDPSPNPHSPLDQAGVSELITPGLLRALRAEYRMKWNGIHGFAHWCRVREIGLRLADQNGADRKVIEYFAFFHDNQRHNDSIDPLHGQRASNLIREKFVPQLALTPDEIKLLCKACQGHTYGGSRAQLTIATCWDADRLDLMRVGTMPDKRYLCTPQAKQDEIINWAVERSLAWATAQLDSGD
jgi:uncharacterized protein